MKRTTILAVVISMVVLFIASAFAQLDYDDPKTRVVSSNDYKSVMTTLLARKDLSTNYVFKRMLYVFGLPGGLMTNEISVRLENCRNSRRELIVSFHRSNEHWNVGSLFRIYDHVGLMGNVPYGAAEIISRAIEKSDIYGSGHRIVSIIGSDCQLFKILTTPPKGTDFVVVLEPNQGISAGYDQRRVFVSVDNGIVRLLSKQDYNINY